MLSLAGKVAVVTGAGSVGPGWGNGKATAVLLARQGAAVFAIDLQPEAVAETQGIIEGEGGTCVPHRCDMLDSEQVAAAMAACRDRFGRLDLLVNNVGGSHPGGPVDMPEEVWDRQRSEEHTSELQSRQYLVCRLLLEKKTNISSSFLFLETTHTL